MKLFNNLLVLMILFILINFQSEKVISNNQMNKNTDSLENTKIFKKFLSSQKLYKFKKSDYPIEGLVPDEETAIKLVDVYFKKYYKNFQKNSENYKETQVYIAVLIDGKIWRVSNFAPLINSPLMHYIDIQKLDGKVISIFRSK